MPHSHHSHSGSYCNHAVSTLSSVVSTAAARSFSLYALTEHCPRSDKYLYPGEATSGWNSEKQWRIFDEFTSEACQLRKEYDSKSMRILVGFEAEWIEPVESEGVVRELLRKYEGKLDYFVGSVHHVKTIPIDYDQAHYDRAVEECGSEIDLFEAYFDAQYEMLQTLQPKVVGHLDLIRLYSDAADEDRGWQGIGDGTVWQKIVRNLVYINSYGGCIELNTSALRKGKRHPYPRMEIVKVFDSMGGKCVVSDDSHGIDHIGTNYEKLLAFVKEAGIRHIAYLDKGDDEAGVVVKTMSIDDFEKHPFWKS